MERTVSCTGDSSGPTYERGTTLNSSNRSCYSYKKNYLRDPIYTWSGRPQGNSRRAQIRSISYIVNPANILASPESQGQTVESSQKDPEFSHILTERGKLATPKVQIANLEVSKVKNRGKNCGQTHEGRNMISDDGVPDDRSIKGGPKSTERSQSQPPAGHDADIVKGNEAARRVNSHTVPLEKGSLSKIEKEGHSYVKFTDIAPKTEKCNLSKNIYTRMDFSKKPSAQQRKVHSLNSSILRNSRAAETVSTAVENTLLTNIKNGSHGTENHENLCFTVTNPMNIAEPDDNKGFLAYLDWRRRKRKDIRSVDFSKPEPTVFDRQHVLSTELPTINSSIFTSPGIFRNGLSRRRPPLFLFPSSNDEETSLTPKQENGNSDGDSVPNSAGQPKSASPNLGNLSTGRRKYSQVSFDLDKNQCLEFSGSDTPTSPGKRIQGYISSTGDAPGEGENYSRSAVYRAIRDKCLRLNRGHASRPHPLNFARPRPRLRTHSPSHLFPTRFAAQLRWNAEFLEAEPIPIYNTDPFSNENMFRLKHSSVSPSGVGDLKANSVKRNPVPFNQIISCETNSLPIDMFSRKNLTYQPHNLNNVVKSSI